MKPITGPLRPQPWITAAPSSAMPPRTPPPAPARCAPAPSASRRRRPASATMQRRPAARPAGQRQHGVAGQQQGRSARRRWQRCRTGNGARGSRASWRGRENGRVHGNCGPVGVRRVCRDRAIRGGFNAAWRAAARMHAWPGRRHVRGGELVAAAGVEWMARDSSPPPARWCGLPCWRQPRATAATASPPCAPTPGISSGSVGASSRTRAISAGQVALTTRPSWPWCGSRAPARAARCVRTAGRR